VAQAGAVGLQVLRDWVLRFNADRPGGLIYGKAPTSRRSLMIPTTKRLRGLWRVDRSQRSTMWCAGVGRVWRFGHSGNFASRLRKRALRRRGTCSATTQRRGHAVASCLNLVPGSAGCPRRANHRPRRKYNTGKLISPPNITLLPLAPGAPELNSVETIWQFIRDSYLSSSIFGSYDEIVALCCEIWNKRIDQPWRIMSIGCRKSAYGF
jgi:hypothetical protein